MSKNIIKQRHFDNFKRNLRQNTSGRDTSTPLHDDSNLFWTPSFVNQLNNYSLQTKGSVAR